MSRLSRKELEQASRNSDPTLAVEGLEDFLPSQSDLDADATLTASALHELFPSRSTPPVAVREALVASPSDPAPGEDGLRDYFSDFEEWSTLAGEEDGEVERAAPGPDADAEFETPTQRFAAEFQRFADRFHAFAVECQR